LNNVTLRRKDIFKRRKKIPSKKLTLRFLSKIHVLYNMGKSMRKLNLVAGAGLNHFQSISSPQYSKTVQAEQNVLFWLHPLSQPTPPETQNKNKKNKKTKT
jgi:hypothetical protein